MIVLRGDEHASRQESNARGNTRCFLQAQAFHALSRCRRLRAYFSSSPF